MKITTLKILRQNAPESQRPKVLNFDIFEHLMCQSAQAKGCRTRCLKSPVLYIVRQIALLGLPRTVLTVKTPLSFARKTFFKNLKNMAVASESSVSQF